MACESASEHSANAAVPATNLVFEHAVFHPVEASEQRLILYSPVPEHDTAAKLATLIEAITRA